MCAIPLPPCFPTRVIVGSRVALQIAPVLLLATATLGGFVALLLALHPRLSLVECAAAAPPVGLTLSAWLALLLKSFIFQTYVRHHRVSLLFMCWGLR